MFSRIKWYHFLGLLVVLSMVLAACQPQATEAPVVEEPAEEEAEMVEEEAEMEAEEPAEEEAEMAEEEAEMEAEPNHSGHQSLQYY